jgi:hypothetical protein
MMVIRQKNRSIPRDASIYILSTVGLQYISAYHHIILVHPASPVKEIADLMRLPRYIADSRIKYS